MRRHTRFFPWLAAMLAVLCLSGCADHVSEPVPVPETEAPVTLPAETTIPQLTEPTVDAPAVLTKERDSEKLCLRLQPTGVVMAGDECRYYTPENQESWLSAYEAALENCIPESGWKQGDKSSGVFLQYGDEWWCLLQSGDILPLSMGTSSGRIPRESCGELNTLVEDALAALEMESAVQPEEIHDLCKATLHWNGIHTLTDPGKLRQLETMLSRSEELWGGANCWFTAPLTLERKDGTLLTLSMATDSCGTWLSQGVFYQYANGNEEFYGLFEPEDDELVLVQDYLPHAFQRLRYAEEGNFTGQQVYRFTEAYLRYGTVKKLQGVSDELYYQGYRLLIWDAFRPLSAQQALWDAYPDPNYVAPPGSGYQGHCRGITVDVTLADELGFPVEMPSDYDDFTQKGDRDYADCTPEAAANAKLLEDTMERWGFTGYQKAWWQFTDNTNYPVDEQFEPQILRQYLADCDEFLTLRRRPATTAEALCRIPAGEAVMLFADCGEFAYVSYQGQMGYVLRSYLTEYSG